MRVNTKFLMLAGIIVLGLAACSTSTTPEAVEEPDGYVEVFLDNGLTENFRLDGFLFALQDYLEITDAGCVVQTITTEAMSEVIFFGQTQSPCSGEDRWEFQVTHNGTTVRGHCENFSDYVQVRGSDFNTGYEKFINFGAIDRIVFNRS